MTDSTAALARSITRAGSKQSYYIARLMVDKGLVDDAFRAYAYLRWTDDVVDVVSRSRNESISFIQRQLELIDRLYSKEPPSDLTSEEEMVAVLISNDLGELSGLQSFLRNMLAIIEFDAQRKGKLISHQELDWYTDVLSISITDGLQYFIGHGHRYPAGGARLLAAKAAHIAHLLRDHLQDLTEGYINIPREYLETHSINPDEVESPPFRAWVQDRVMLARDYFTAGKEYFDRVDVLRFRIVTYWYWARFEGVLDMIERDGYVLRESYGERRKFPTLLKIAWQGLSLPIRHVVGRGVSVLRP